MRERLSPVRVTMPVRALFREKFCSGDARLLHCAVDRPRTSIMGHYYRLYRFADLGGGLAEQKSLSSGRHRCGGLRHRCDRTCLRQYADPLQRDAVGLDHVLPLFISAGAHPAGVCLCAGRVHCEPDWFPCGIRPRQGFNIAIIRVQEIVWDLLRGADTSLCVTRAYLRPVQQ